MTDEPKHYRLLNVGEVIQEGDEFYGLDQEWFVVASSRSGMVVHENSPPHRRPCDLSAKLAEQTQRTERAEECYLRAWNQRDAQRRRAEAAEAKLAEVTRERDEARELNQIWTQHGRKGELADLRQQLAELRKQEPEFAYFTHAATGQVVSERVADIEIQARRLGVEVSYLYAAPHPAPDLAVKVKPLDLSNLLRHAYMDGFLVAGGTNEAAAQWWPEYDPEECPAYARILAALDAAPQPADPGDSAGTYQSVEEYNSIKTSLPQPSGDREALLGRALSIAVNEIMRHEPGDSRAVSNLAVALASVSAGVENQSCLDLLAEYEANPAISAPSAGDGWQVPPININFMLACYVSPEPGGVIWPGGWQSSAGKDTRDWLVRNGLVASDYSPTERGNRWVEALLSTPLPAPPTEDRT